MDPRASPRPPWAVFAIAEHSLRHSGTRRGLMTILIVGAGATGAPRVIVYDLRTGAMILSFYAYDSSVTGGVNVAVGDVDGDHIGDIVTGAGGGVGFASSFFFSWLIGLTIKKKTAKATMVN